MRWVLAIQIAAILFQSNQPRKKENNIVRMKHNIAAQQEVNHLLLAL